MLTNKPRAISDSIKKLIKPFGKLRKSGDAWVQMPQNKAATPPKTVTKVPGHKVTAVNMEGRTLWIAVQSALLGRARDWDWALRMGCLGWEAS